MATVPVKNRLYYFKRPTRWQSAIGEAMPEAYKKFWKEWKLIQPTAVHYVEEKGKYKWNEKSGYVEAVQNIPLPLLYPKELDRGIWGGEAVVQGFQKKGKYCRRVAKFWTPRLMKSVVHSEVLNLHMRTIVTMRTLDLIHANYGFDHYLLKTPACDLRSLLALRIKRNILIALADKTLYPDDPLKREEIYEKYKQYLTAYTREEIEWYGLSWREATEKLVIQNRLARKIEPLKVQYRSEFIRQLKEAQIAEAEGVDVATENQSWLSRVNPFSRSPKT